MPPRSSSRSQSRPRAAGPQDYDPTTRFLYVPHTVTFLLAGFVAVAYFSHPLNPPQRSTIPEVADQTAYLNAKTGIWALVLVFLGYSVVQGPSTKMVRPHPAFWRLVHGLVVCYLLFWVYMVFQTVDDARLFLRHMYPELGIDLGERRYGDDCALLLPNGGGINWPAIKGTVFDEFTVAHTLGWWGKALIIRDNVMLWIISISFELMELTFQHWLPNFNECWWDSWLLDVAICNAIGIVTGMWTVRYFKSKQYNWRGISEQPNLVAKARRGLLQFTPYSYQDFRWRLFSSPKRCLQCLFPAGIILLFEVNHFFLKYELWVPPRNPLNAIRLSLLLLLALPGIKEYYEFIDSGQTDIFRKVGTFAWLGMAVAFVETLAVIKFGYGLFSQPWPKQVLIAWGTVGTVFLIVFSTWSSDYESSHGLSATQMAVMRGQHYRRSFGSIADSIQLKNPHLAASYSVFKSATHTVQGSARCRIKTRAASRSINPLPRVFGVSDIHTDYLENFAWAEALDKQAFRNDILLLAGDVCDELTLLEDTLTLLKNRFESVFYCPGNHCLWIRSTDASINSYEKLQKILSLCASLDVYTAPKRIENVWIAPIQSWHHKSFDTDPDIPDIPAASALTIADYAACTWPEGKESLLPPGSQRNGSLELAQWFDSLNDGPIWEEMLETRDKCDVISFSHFLPDITLMPEKRFLFYPNLVKASGSLPLAKRIDVLKPNIHLFGHTHFAWDTQIQETRYIQAPLGAPLERHRRLRTLCFNAFMTEEKKINNNNDDKNKNKKKNATTGSTWTTAGDPTEAKWLPVELYQFNSHIDLCPLNDDNSERKSDALLSTAGTEDSSSSSWSPFSSTTECPQPQHRGPSEPLRDAFTAANEATHGIILPLPNDAGSIIESSSDDDPLSLCKERGHGREEDDGNVCIVNEQRNQLRYGTMPGLLGAHWSEYYATNPRTPEITTLAPWVAHLYKKRRQRREKENENKTPPANAAATSTVE